MAEKDPVKETVDELNKAWLAFKEEHKKGGGADKDKLAKIEADIVTRDAAHQKYIEVQASDKEKLLKHIDELEKKLNRRELGGGGGNEREEEAKEARASFFAYCRVGLREPGAEEKWTEWRKKTGLKLEQKVLTVADDTTGGFLATPDYIREIIKAEVLFSPMRELVRVRSTSSRSVQIPKRTGTAAAVWVGEVQTRTETQNPSYGLVECHTHEMTAEVYISFQDLEDSAFDLEAELRQEFAEQFAVTEGAAVVNGTGVNKPFGFLDAGQNIAFTASGGTTTIADATGQANGIITLFHAVKSAYAARGRWVLNRQTLGSVRKLQDSQKRYLWEPSPQVGTPSMILGAPYTEVPDMPNEGSNAFPMAFGDWNRAYTLVDRISMSVLRDPFTRANVGQVKFLARRRMGGQVVLAEAIRLLKCA